MPIVVDTVDQFNKLLEEAGDKVVVVDFFAEWCGPCKMIGPKLEDIAKTHQEKIVVIKVDVDKNETEELNEKYGITAMPTFIFIKNGQKINEVKGANEAKLLAVIEAS